MISYIVPSNPILNRCTGKIWFRIWFVSSLRTRESIVSFNPGVTRANVLETSPCCAHRSRAPVFYFVSAENRKHASCSLASTGPFSTFPSSCHRAINLEILSLSLPLFLSDVTAILRQGMCINKRIVFVPMKNENVDGYRFVNKVKRIARIKFLDETWYANSMSSMVSRIIIINYLYNRYFKIVKKFLNLN